MSVVKYIECDICNKRINEWHKEFRGRYSFGECKEHVCWECWKEMKKFVEQKKKEKQEG